MWMTTPLLQGSEQQQELPAGLYLRNSSYFYAVTGSVLGKKPTGTQPTDILVAVITAEVNDFELTVTAPSGWTKVDSGTLGNGLTTGFIFTYWAPGTVEQFDFYFSQTGAAVVLAIFAFSGANLANPIRAASTHLSMWR